MQMLDDARLEWTTSRDGSRTAKVGGKWLAGCSVPKRSAEMMLRNLVVRGNVLCLLYPTHAQQIVATLERLEGNCALIVIATDESEIELFRSFHDFDAFEGRLFFANDVASLKEIFQINPGLPIPTQFIRLPVSKAERTDEAIRWAQGVFSDVAAAQNMRTESARRNWRGGEHPCVIVNDSFSLWNDPASALTAFAAKHARVNIADARQSASALLAETASTASALIAVDFARVDQPNLIAMEQPWISWITKPRIPAFIHTSRNDALLLAGESWIATAIEKGWPRDRVAIAQWPLVEVPRHSGASLVLLCDLPSLTPPQAIEELSSHRVVWDAIRKDLLENPHRLAGDVDGYLEKSRRHFGVPAENFPTSIFANQLIAAAYTIGIVKCLIKENIPVTIHGRGWETTGIESKGAIHSREGFINAFSTAVGVIDPFVPPGHPVRSIGLPELKTFGRTSQRIIQDARAILAERIAPQTVQNPLTESLISGFIGSEKSAHSQSGALD